METLVPCKQKKRRRERATSVRQEAAADSLAAAGAIALASHVSKWKKEIRKKRRLAAEGEPAARQDAHQLAPQVGIDRINSKGTQIQAVDATALASHVSEAKQAFKWKKRRKKKRHLAAEEDPAAHHDAHQHAPHVGVDRTNSNWKQLQATLMKGRAARKNQNTVHKEQAVGVDVTKSGKFPTKHTEDASQRSLELLSPKNEDCSLTKVLAMDCEMVGAGLDGKRSILARVSLVNMWGNVVYDKHVRPKEQVTDYRTNISGVRASNLRKGEDFTMVQKEVAELILGRVLVGHSLRNDLKIMYLSHPKKDIRDTAAYPPLRNTNGRPRALRHIAGELLGVKIQVGEHCSVQDARAAMYIYQHLKREWEGNMSKRCKS